MKRLQRTMKGVYFIEIPNEIIRISGIKEGDEFEIMTGGDIPIRTKDIVLMKK